MELYIEKAFLDHFFVNYTESSASRNEKILLTILKEYGEVTWFIDVPIETPKDLENLKLENPFFAFRTGNFPPIPVTNFKNHFFNSSHRQTLIFSEREREWFNEAENKGALCFTVENYQQRIEQYVEQCSVRIDLFEKFSGWDLFDFHNSLPNNKIIISDRHILSDNSNQRMDENIIPLLKVLLKKANKQNSTKVNIITEKFNPKNGITDERIKETAKKKYKRLKKVFENKNVQFQIIRYDKSNLPTNYDIHDRVICSNFHFIECGKGFNLMPAKISDSRIIAENIFDKFSYRTLKNRIKLYEIYIDALKKAPPHKFTAYPPLMN